MRVVYLMLNVSHVIGHWSSNSPFSPLCLNRAIKFRPFIGFTSHIRTDKVNCAEIYMSWRLLFFFKWQEIPNGSQVEALAGLHGRAGSEEIILCSRMPLLGSHSCFTRVAEFCRSNSSPRKHVENLKMFDRRVWYLNRMMGAFSC